MRSILSIKQLAITTALAAVFLAPWTLVEAQQGAVSQEAALAEARKLTDELTDKVRALLMRELEQGGYEGAVRACSEVAQKVTADFSAQTGRYARRVSLGYRNPKDIPDDYERAKLEEFDRQRREGKLEREYYEVVSEKDGRYLRYMRPLVTAKMCLNCHGQVTEIPHAVMSQLQRRYPNDKALGYSEGDVRGAVSVRIALKPAGGS